jgi:hypothetical protein
MFPDDDASRETDRERDLGSELRLTRVRIAYVENELAPLRQGLRRLMAMDYDAGYSADEYAGEEQRDPLKNLPPHARLSVDQH